MIAYIKVKVISMFNLMATSLIPSWLNILFRRIKHKVSNESAQHIRRRNESNNAQERYHEKPYKTWRKK